MKVKIDTKEKFHVITVNEEVLAANMTEDLKVLLNGFLKDDIKHVVINFQEVKIIEDKIAHELTRIQQTFYDNNTSFVICSLNSDVESSLDKLELLELMNVTPTESEAWDIVQMEEVERELLDEE